MKKYTLAAAVGVALFLFAGQAPATVITFTGVVDAVRGPLNLADFAVGDPFSATFFFDPKHFGRIDEYSLTLGNFSSEGIATGGQIVLALDPTRGAVLYQVFQFFSPDADPYSGMHVAIDLQAGTPNGIIPPFEQFNLNGFHVGLSSPDDFEHPDSASGHLTSFPTIRNEVPDSGSTLTVFSSALIGLAMLRRYLHI